MTRVTEGMLVEAKNSQFFSALQPWQPTSQTNKKQSVVERSSLTLYHGFRLIILIMLIQHAEHNQANMRNREENH